MTGTLQNLFPVTRVSSLRSSLLKASFYPLPSAFQIFTKVEFLLMSQHTLYLKWLQMTNPDYSRKKIPQSQGDHCLMQGWQSLAVGIHWGIQTPEQMVPLPGIPDPGRVAMRAQKGAQRRHKLILSAFTLKKWALVFESALTTKWAVFTGYI